MGEEGPGIRRQMVAHRAPHARSICAGMGRHSTMLVVERDHAVARFEPEALADQAPGDRVEGAFELDMAIPVHGGLRPDAEIGRDGRQGPQDGALEFETRERRFAGRAMAADAGLFEDPAFRLIVEVDQIAELPQRQKVALEVLDAGLDDALLLWIVWRAGVDAEAVAFGTVGVGALRLRIVRAGLGDGALGVVDDQARRHGAEPFESAAVAAEPGGHRLVPDELDVLVAREAQGHDEGPSTAHRAGSVGQQGAGAEIHLGRFARNKDEPPSVSD